MTPTVSDIWHLITQWAPEALAESWDNIGLQVGDPRAQVRRILVALDATPRTLQAAAEARAELVVTHHPLIFKPLSHLDISEQIPRLLAGFLRSDTALLAAHTNLDSALGGVNDRLADLIGLGDVQPLLPGGVDAGGAGLGRIGRLCEPSTLPDLCRRVAAALRTDGLRVVGDSDQVLQRVALCSGSGAELWTVARDAGAEVFITAEVKHHVAIEAEAAGMVIIDAGHFHTEWPIVPKLADFLKKQGGQLGWDLEVVAFEAERPPVRLWRET